MPQPLYFRRYRFQIADGYTDEAIANPRVEYQLLFGVTPRGQEEVNATRRISLKDDLGWREVADLQNVMWKSDFWESFPENNLVLISAEVKAGQEEQRIDLLYVTIRD